MNAPLPIAGAVALRAALSDLRSPLRLDLVTPASHRGRLNSVLERSGTTLSLDTGLAAFFRDPQQAVNAALRLHREAALLALTYGDAAPLALRIALDCSREDEPAEMARGHALSRASALLMQGRDHSLLLSRAIYDALSGELRERARRVPLFEGQPEDPLLHDLFDLDWRSSLAYSSDVTGNPEPIETLIQQSVEQLELSHGGDLLSISPGDCPFTLGRDKKCGLPLGGDVASRVHGRIEFVQERFYYVDDSRNGTYVLNPQGEEVFLHRERLPLLGRGVISPGAPIVKQTGEVVRYCSIHLPAVGTQTSVAAPAPAHPVLESALNA